MRVTDSTFDTAKNAGQYQPTIYLQFQNVTNGSTQTFVDGESFYLHLMKINNFQVNVDLESNMAVVGDLIFSLNNHLNQFDTLIGNGLKIGGFVNLKVGFVISTGFSSTILLMRGKVSKYDRKDDRFVSFEIVDVMKEIYESQVAIKSRNLQSEGFYPIVFGRYRVDHHASGDNLTSYVDAGVQTLLPTQDGSEWKHHNFINLAQSNKAATGNSFLVHKATFTDGQDCPLKNIYSVWAYDSTLQEYVKIAPFFDLVKILTLKSNITNVSTSMILTYEPSGSTVNLKLTGDAYIKIDSEIIKFSYISCERGEMYISGMARGQLGTLANGHLVGTTLIYLYQYYFEIYGFKTRVYFPFLPVSAHYYVYPKTTGGGRWPNDFTNPDYALDRDGSTYALATPSVSGWCNHLYLNYIKDQLSSLKKHRFYIDLQVAKLLSGSGVYRWRLYGEKTDLDLSLIADRTSTDQYTRKDPYSILNTSACVLISGPDVRSSYISWRSIANCSFYIQVDYTPIAVSNLNFPTVNSIPDICTIIKNGINAACGYTAVEVRYNNDRFEIQNFGMGPAYNVGFLSATGSGTDISGPNYLDMRSDKATITLGSQQNAETIMKSGDWKLPQLDIQASITAARAGSVFRVHAVRQVIAYEYSPTTIYIECNGAQDTTSGAITGVAGALLENPFDAAVLLTEASALYVEKASDYNTQRGKRNNFICRGVIGSQVTLKEVLSKLARQNHFVYTVSSELATGLSKVRLTAIESQTSVYAFTIANMGSFKIDYTKSSNDVQIYYDYDPVAKKYKVSSYANRAACSHSVPATASSLISKCLAGYTKNGEQAPLIINADYIYDQTTADNLLTKLVWQWAEGEQIACFKSGFNAIHLELGDYVTITHPLLGSDSGLAFMVINVDINLDRGDINFRAVRTPNFATLPTEVTNPIIGS